MPFNNGQNSVHNLSRLVKKNSENTTCANVISVRKNLEEGLMLIVYVRSCRRRNYGEI